MWALLSSRIRTWLVIAVAIPIARRLVRRASAAADRRDPNAGAAKVLRRADSVLSGLSRRLGRRGRRSRA